MTQCSPDSARIGALVRDLLLGQHRWTDDFRWGEYAATVGKAVETALARAPAQAAHREALEKIVKAYVEAPGWANPVPTTKLVYNMYEIARDALAAQSAVPQCTCGRPLECPECMSLRTEPQASQIVAWRWRLKGNTDWWLGETVPTAISGNGNWEIEPLGVLQATPPQAATMTDEEPS